MSHAPNSIRPAWLYLTTDCAQFLNWHANSKPSLMTCTHLSKRSKPISPPCKSQAISKCCGHRLSRDSQSTKLRPKPCLRRAPRLQPTLANSLARLCKHWRWRAGNSVSPCTWAQPQATGKIKLSFWSLGMRAVPRALWQKWRLVVSSPVFHWRSLSSLAVQHVSRP